MAKEEPVNWQPISQMPLIASMISTSLVETREHLGTLTKAKDRPHVLDDATIDRVEQVHAEQMEFVTIYTQQISRWRAEKPSPARISELDRMDTQNQQLREVTKAVLDLADDLRQGTIDRVLAMSDFELGLQTLLGTPLSGRR
jgi:hypothetical protein